LICALSSAISLIRSPGWSSASRILRIASSMIGSSSLPWTKPRVMISGRPTTRPVC